MHLKHDSIYKSINTEATFLFSRVITISVIQSVVPLQKWRNDFEITMTNLKWDSNKVTGNDNK